MYENTRPPGRETYFNLLRPHFLETDIETIQAAYEFSKYGHTKQKRESGERYFDHPKAVSLILFQELRVFDCEIIRAALLHDVREDSYILSERRMIINFGKETAYTVKLLTKDKNNEDIYYTLLAQSGDWRAVLIKIADRIHNMRTLSARPKDKQVIQVKETRDNFFELCNVLEKNIPERYKYVVSEIRTKLRKLCKTYE